MQTLIIVIHLMIVIAMIGFVLLQKSEGGGLGIGSTGGFLTSRGTANVLTRSTAILAGAFFATSLILSILAGLNRHPASILQSGGGTPQAPVSGGAPAQPGGGQSGSGGGLLGTLQQQEQAPAGPQVPQSK
jgi:preprotein translocase subunit SecG